VNDYTYVDNNLVKLQVFFKEMVYVDYTESPSYPVSSIHEKQYCIYLIYRRLYLPFMSIICTVGRVGHKKYTKFFKP